MTLQKKSPLTSLDWLRAAFLRLSIHGVSALKAETLAKQLKTTKGSFYWHFKDVSTFKTEMLNLWEEEATKAIMNAVTGSEPKGAARLVKLSVIVSQMNTQNSYGGVQAEPAIRDWARVDTQAANAMVRVDAARVAFVKRLFMECGFVSADAKLRAELFYSGFLGLQALAAISPMDVGCRLEKLLAMLLKP